MAKQPTLYWYMVLGYRGTSPHPKIIWENYARDKAHALEAAEKANSQFAEHTGVYVSEDYHSPKQPYNQI